MGEENLVRTQVRTPDCHLTILQQVPQLFLIGLDLLVGLVHLLFMVTLIQIHLSFSTEVSDRGDIETQVTLFVEGRTDL